MRDHWMPLLHVDAASRFVGLQQPQIILLREGTDTSQGKPQLVSNINACVAVVDAVRTTLGPRGMDKLVIDDRVRIMTSPQHCTTAQRCLGRSAAGSKP